MLKPAILFFGLILLGAGCAASEDPGFVVNGSTMVVPGQAGGEIRAGTMPMVPELSVDGSGL
ncbi:hypothetical protein KBC59_04385 [Patescibacteria group bacterium]|jgi:hypothetical protein|nr:hypothetical protein [Patescibacteria group bacterium]